MLETPEKRNSRGGSRPGSGRKVIHKEGKTKLIAFTIPESLIDQLDVVARQKGWNRSMAATEAIRKFVLGKGK